MALPKEPIVKKFFSNYQRYFLQWLVIAFSIV